MRQALVLAERMRASTEGAIGACMNLSYLLALAGRMAEAQELDRARSHARPPAGDRVWEQCLLTNLSAATTSLGDWDEVERLVDEIPQEGADRDERRRRRPCSSC